MYNADIFLLIHAFNEFSIDFEVDEMEKELRNLFDARQVDAADISFGFHWPPFTSVPHLHMHGIAPASKMRWLSRWIFKPLNVWYCTVNKTNTTTYS